MVIKSCEMLGGTVKRALPAAGAVELVHNFTLVHDDIMDNDEMRHGTATVHRSYGVPLAILAGDILFSKSFELLTFNCRKAGISDKAIGAMVGKLSVRALKFAKARRLISALASGSKTPERIRLHQTWSEKRPPALFEVSCALGALSAPNHTDVDIKNLSSVWQEHWHCVSAGRRLDRRCRRSQADRQGCRQRSAGRQKDISDI